MAAVERGDRDRWLATFAQDAHVEDPVAHVAPMDGREALARFWDTVIAALPGIRFDVTRAWEAGDEAMLLAEVTVTTPADTEVRYDGAFNYRIDPEGRIASLRAFWDPPG